MPDWRPFPAVVVSVIVALSPSVAAGQVAVGTSLAELIALKSKVGNAETRVRVDALHQVWSIALGSDSRDVKLTALDLLTEPVGSSSDHIRMPAVYAIVDIAGSSRDVEVQRRALAALAEPLGAEQVPIRNVAIDAVNAIVASAERGQVAVAAVAALGPPARSGNNGVRIPAINALVRAVKGSGSDQASQAAIDLLVSSLDSSAMIGGFEVRMMAIRAVETIGVDASGIATKAKAMGLLQSYAFTWGMGAGGTAPCRGRRGGRSGEHVPIGQPRRLPSSSHPRSCRKAAPRWLTARLISSLTSASVRFSGG